MGYFFKSLTEFISVEDVATLSSRLNEDHSKVHSAVKILISGFLDSFMRRKPDKHANHLLLAAGNQSILLKVSDIFSENLKSEMRRIGFKFQHYLFGDKKDTFIEIMSSTLDIKKEKVKRLTIIVSCFVAGFLGEKLVSGITIKEIRKQIFLEEEAFIFPVEIEEIIAKPTFFDRIKSRYLNRGNLFLIIILAGLLGVLSYKVDDSFSKKEEIGLGGEQVLINDSTQTDTYLVE